jgi:hypothetical protein
MKNFLRALLLLSIVFPVACVDESSPVPTDIDPRIEFVGAPDDAIPHTARDGFPVRVRVSTAVAGLQGSIKATVRVLDAQGALSAVMGVSTMTEATAVLGDTSDGRYATVLTLNAPGPGTVTVQAEIAGVERTKTGTIVAPRLAGAVTATAVWAGTAPRYAVCVESSAVKGIVDLTSDDPAILAAPTGAGASLSGTLVPGPCEPAVPGGPKTTHASIVLAFMPPFTLQASLRGRPIAADPLPWTTTLIVPKELVPAVGLVLEGKPTGALGPTGSIFTVTASATSAGTSVTGMNVQFSSAPSGALVSAASVPTDVSGKATATFLVPYNGSLLLGAAGGGAFVDLFLAGEANPITLTLSSIADGPVVSTGRSFTVTAHTVAKNVPLAGVGVAFGVLAGSGSVTPGSVTTDPGGNASTTVFVPAGKEAVISANVGSIVKQIVLTN